MNQTNEINPLQEATCLRLLAAALELQHLTGTGGNLVRIPGGERVIAVGTPAQVRALLGIEPIRETSIGVLDALDSVTGVDIANIEAFKTERFYLADDVDGLIARCWQKPAAAQERCPHCDDTGAVHSPTGEWRGQCTCQAGATDSEGGHHD